MKFNSSENHDKGFTIIEVLIVLAIAGFILLIVLLAVPALQRNARNTQRKNDAASLLAGVNSYITNNGGTMPQTVGSSGNDVTFCGASCGSGNTESAKVGFYNAAADVSITASIPGVYPGTNNVTILTGYACPSTPGTLPTSAEADGRNAVALFSTETGTSSQSYLCQEL